MTGESRGGGGQESHMMGDSRGGVRSGEPHDGGQ